MKKCIFAEQDLIFAALLLIGFAARVIYNLLQPDSGIYNFLDASDYENAALGLLREHKFPTTARIPFFRAPFYPIFIYFLYLFSPQNFMLIRISQSVLITASAFLIYKIAGKFFPKGVAIVSASIFLFHPYFFYVTSYIMTESLFLFLQVLALWLLLKFGAQPKRKLYFLFLSGLLGGIAILTRPAAIIFVAATLIYLAALKRGIKFIIKSGSVFVISCALAILPWVIRNYLVYNEFIFCNDAGGYTFFLGNSNEEYERLTTKDKSRFQYLNNIGIVDRAAVQIKKFEREENYSALTPKTRERLWYREAFIYIKHNKLQYVKLTFLKAWDYLRPFLHPMCYLKKYVLISLFINGPIFLFGVAGIFLAFKNKELKPLTILFASYFIMSIFPHALFYTSNRYRIVFIDPYLYIYASYAFMRFGPWVRKKIL